MIREQIISASTSFYQTHLFFAHYLGGSASCRHSPNWQQLLLFKIWFDWQQSSFCFLGLVGFLILIYGLTIAASSYGNTLVLWIVSTTKSLQNVNNLLIANLAFSDIMIALLCTPFQFYAALAQKWQLPEIMCKICPFFQCVCVNVNIFNLVLIAQDRWV